MSKMDWKKFLNKVTDYLQDQGKNLEVRTKQWLDEQIYAELVYQTMNKLAPNDKEEGASNSKEFLSENFLKMASSSIEESMLKGVFESVFDQLSVFGKGGYGTVYKVKHKIDDQLYAIKRIVLSENQRDKCMEEVKTLVKIKNENVVNYITSWSEEDSIYIQMEFCEENLASIIKNKSKFFRNDQCNKIEPAEYFICCEIFREILGCVHYLHELEPPLIHLDIKPENILFKRQNKNGKFIKLCDFGLSKFQEVSILSSTNGKGTIRYMAPEVSPPNGRSQFSTKADIYSLGITALDLFEYDINSSEDSLITTDTLSDKWNELIETITRMTASIYRRRPSCAELLFDTNQWAIEKEDFEYELENSTSTINQTSVFYEYIKFKLV